MIRSGPRWGFFVAVLAAVAVAIPSLTVAADSAAKPNATTAGHTPEALPDWSGWWYLELEPHETPATRYLSKAPLKPDVAARVRAAAAPLQRPTSVDEAGTLKTLQCLPPRFAGLSGGFVEDIEFLFSPGRVTLLNESGLIRRIFTGAERPDEMESTDNGISTGHWEGQTLVVETHALNPNARFGPNWPGVPTIGRDVQVRERISLRNENTLEIVVRMEVPELFTAPFNVTFVYLRDRDHRFHEQSDCVDEDRSIDPQSGGQRFDLTPPPGLPPPPKN
jgi:hypothetical protein